MASYADLLAAKEELSARFLPLSRTVGTVHRSGTFSIAAAVGSAGTNVHAVGIGRKEVAGRVTRRWAVRLHVGKKLPLSLIPKAFRLPERIDGVPVDVIESPPAFLAGRVHTASTRIPRSRRAVAVACTKKRQHTQRPLIAGISVAHFRVTAGTLGFFCKSTRGGETNDTYILGNNHVIADLNRALPGDAIYQPGPADGGTVKDTVAQYSRCVPISTASQARNKVDAAIALVRPNVSCVYEICSIGRVSGIEPPRDQARVRKHGRTSGYREGRITESSSDVLVGLDPTDPAAVALFTEQIRIEPDLGAGAFALPGDSGALVISTSRPLAVGLFFACPDSGSYGIANPIGEVLRQLDVTLL